MFTNEIFRFIPKQCMLEREPIRKLTNKKELIAFKHNGFWQCMDTLRDKKLLCKLWKSKKNKW